MTEKASARPGRGVGDAIRNWWAGLSRPAQWGIGVPAIIVLALIPLFPPPVLNTPGTSFGGVMAQFAMYALLAVGLNVVVGQSGLLDLGYVGFYAVGAYTIGVLTSPNSPWNQVRAGGAFDARWAWLACVPIAILITAVSGLILGSPTLRLRGDYLAIVTLGFGEIVRLMADNLGDITNGSLGLSGIAYPRLGESGTHAGGYFSAGNFGDSHSLNPLDRANSGTWWFWIGMVLVIGVLLLVGNLERSRAGRAWVAIREDEDVAEMMGVPTFKFKLLAFTIGAAIGGLSGALYAGQVQFINPTGFNVINSMLFLVAVVLGGQGNKLGVIVGAFLIVYLPNRFMSVNVAGQSLGDFKYLFFGITLVVVMIFRPQGLFPVRQKLLAYGRQVYKVVRRPIPAPVPAEATGVSR
ncbi:branched-chain amino acid ABC transporter permease [Nocardia terpenica]|uniref:branched-chain amino acid ABC transporter permease n=1 Tax=Nocardia terpenica TaxID=455432 RepID=UPI001893A13E|nr:branched-chain amino acid ABC transporter permease [Nocardia terpenica]MBF6066230.1 branched-chain amino acid ABC transporter permease [Nocardia terpenica]MBF6109352.1 branched-chain amino acid ABC transporter permease [Nocardia terpenica]MBF6116528.1 branched-chain amino acid ABC transporter permease [Nocardia terpenica]MBF6123653.1 branched-chain amino acid ABC transporter permease [Nocardia terpenica]MBF6156986.1 branched-chain amino acid ABC transporter permease [Nocardia terpenica]